MQVVIGQFNELDPNAFKGDPVRLEGGEVEGNGTMVTVPPAWQASNAVFRVGVGTGESDRKDALTVYKDGTVVIPGLQDPGSGRRLSASDGALEKKLEATEKKLGATEKKLAALEASYTEELAALKAAVMALTRNL